LGGFVDLETQVSSTATDMSSGMNGKIVVSIMGGVILGMLALLF
jgi:hypothetical protein